MPGRRKLDLYRVLGSQQNWPLKGWKEEARRMALIIFMFRE